MRLKPISFIMKFSLLLATCIGGLLILEGGLRLLVAMDVFDENSRYMRYRNIRDHDLTEGSLFRYSSDSALPIELVPNAKTKSISINSHGFRGPEYTVTPAENTIRIALLGDSETFGQRLQEEDTFGHCLESVLNEQRNDSFNYEVLNFGFPGLNTMQYFHVLKERAIQFQPDLVLVYYNLNDVILEQVTSLNKKGYLDYAYLGTLYKSWQLMRQPSVYKKLHKSGDLIPFYQNLYQSKNAQKCYRALTDMADYLNERGIPFFIIIAPEVIGFQNFEQYPYKNIHKQLSTLQKENLKVIDPLESLTALNVEPTDLWVLPIDCHKNKTANQAIANHCAPSILSQSIDKIEK